jgi:hypothetical protein
VLDAMQTIAKATELGRHLELSSTCDRPAPMPEDLREGYVEP